MNILLNKERIKFYLWVGFAYLILNILTNLSNGLETFQNRTINEVWRAIYIIALNFQFFEYILPKINRNKIGKSILFLVVFVFLCSVGLNTWRSIGVVVHIYTSFAKPDTKLLSEQMGSSVGSVFFFGIIKHIYDYIKLKQTAQQLLIEKQAAELNYLKSQTNPHFLFNTLNNIYSLARDKSDLAPESILRLSKILRFMLYETSGKFISIEQELKIINDYIDLEKLRYDDSLLINFNHNIEDMKQALPPLLLIPLVENAFKHGVSETRDFPFIDIHLSINNRILVFLVKNSVETLGEMAVKENIGIGNLRRQLELLYTDYNLTITQGESDFTASLKINLASHV